MLGKKSVIDFMFMERDNDDIIITILIAMQIAMKMIAIIMITMKMIAKKMIAM